MSNDRLTLNYLYAERLAADTLAAARTALFALGNLAAHAQARIVFDEMCLLDKLARLSASVGTLGDLAHQFLTCRCS